MQRYGRNSAMGCFYLHRSDLENWILFLLAFRNVLRYVYYKSRDGYVRRLHRNSWATKIAQSDGRSIKNPPCYKKMRCLVKVSQLIKVVRGSHKTSLWQAPFRSHSSMFHFLCGASMIRSWHIVRILYSYFCDIKLERLLQRIALCILQSCFYFLGIRWRYF